MIDLHVHMLGHKDREATYEVVKSFLDVAVARGLQEIGFADHEYYLEDMNFPLIREAAQEYPGLKVRIGLEVEYRLGEEGRIKDLLAEFPFDYAIGSIHEMGGWIFDIPSAEGGHWERDADEMYREYFDLVARAARSGLFQTLGHLDLIKIFGVRPRLDILEVAAEALSEAAAHGCALEINTAGRYKPVKEFYPEPKLIGEIARRGINFTLGSDAHRAENVGRDFGDALAQLRAAGVTELVSFAGKENVVYPLAYPITPERV